MEKKWTRSGEMPDVQKVTFLVSKKDDPELAEWLWSLPYRGASVKVREVLSANLRLPGRSVDRDQSGGGSGHEPHPAKGATPSPLKVTIPNGIPPGQLGPHYLQTTFGKKDAPGATLTFTHVQDRGQDEPLGAVAPPPSAANAAPKTGVLDDDALNAMRQLGNMG